jgi:phosphoribosylaminoimidazole-succinocarboxamide synthase
MIKNYLDKTIKNIDFPEGLNPYIGKVRHCYDTRDGNKILVTSDRLSAFDRQITTIPFKGQVLTQLSRFWFEQTKDVCPNHVIDYPDPNIVVCKDLEMLSVELVVRGYLAGSTGTSLLTMYKRGERKMYGMTFPDDMRDNQKLEKPIITPTTKAATGDHDAPLSAEQIVEEGILPKDVWEQVSDYALALFARGQEIAAKAGLILVDTKYEFGFDKDGVLCVGDEIHTPDSSRYWMADTYDEAIEKGEAPTTLDKDQIRRWVVARVDAYKDDIPEIPDDLRVSTAETYISVYEKITGQKFDMASAGENPEQRVNDALKKLNGISKAA